MNSEIPCEDTVCCGLFTPGPVPMDDEICRLGGVQTPYFRNDWFSEVVRDCEAGLLQAVRAPKGSRVVFLTASGTAQYGSHCDESADRRSAASGD